MSQRDKPQQGVVASSMKLPRDGTVGFIDRLDRWRGIGIRLSLVNEEFALIWV